MPKHNHAHRHPASVQHDTGSSSHYSASQPSPCKSVSHTGRHSDSKQSPAGRRTAVIQLLLFISTLYIARVLNPKLDPCFLVACGAALAVLLVIKSWAAGKKKRVTVPLTNGSVQQSPQHEAVRPRTPNLTGVWIKDKAASDNMEPTLTLMRVNRLIRTAVGLVKGMQLRQSQDSFEMIVLSGILWFKITEQYPLTGDIRRFKRRDLRKGLHRGSAEKLPDGAICITLEWDDPLGGIGTDVFYSPAPDLLYVDSTILMSGKTVKYRTVYNKQ